MNFSNALNDDDLSLISQEIDMLESRIEAAPAGVDMSEEVILLDQIISKLETSRKTICRNEKVVRLF